MSRANPSDLEGWLEKISRVHPGSMALTLERVAEVYKRMGTPPPAPVTIVVGGTNGKGSAVAMLSAILGRAGMRVGKSTSPHLFRFNERVQVNDRPLDDADLVSAFAAVDSARGDILLTYFEYATLAALWHFAQARVDVAVLEVGLGGRLDAVNIVAANAALITSISIDHTRWLGTTLTQIAREKAGVFKPGQIAVSADRAATPELAAVARAVGARFFAVEQDYRYSLGEAGWNWQCADLELTELAFPALRGQHQVGNAAGCLMVLQQLKLLDSVRDAISPALAGVALKGRLWQVASQPAIVLDVAHNEAGAQVLADWLRQTGAGGRTLLVLGMLREKAPAAFLAALAEEVDDVLLAGLPPPRGLSCQQLGKAVARLDCATQQYPTLAEALDQARQQATAADRILITGSFITVMQAADLLGVGENPAGGARRGEFSGVAPEFDPPGADS